MLMVEVLLQGIGVLINWNAILTSLDWFSSLFPNYNPGVVFGVCNYAPCLIFQPLTAWKGNLFSYNLRIVGAYVVASLVLIFMPIAAASFEESTSFYMVCVMITIMGTFGAIGQTSVFGLGGTMPDKYTNLLLIGNSIAGIVLSSLRLICLASFIDASDGIFYSSILYFSISGCILFTCILAQVHLMKHPLVRKCLESSRMPENEQLNYEEQKEMTWKELFGSLWDSLCLVWLIYFQTFGMLTHVVIATDTSVMPYAYFETMLILIFNIFDVIGRNFCNVYMLKKIPLLACTIGRFVLWISFICIASDDPSVSPSWIFSALWFKVINLALFSFSNGYLSTLSMIYGPAGTPSHMKDRAGNIMSTGLVFGIFSGNLVAFSFSRVGHIPSE